MNNNLLGEKKWLCTDLRAEYVPWTHFAYKPEPSPSNPSFSFARVIDLDKTLP